MIFDHWFGGRRLQPLSHGLIDHDDDVQDDTEVDGFAGWRQDDLVVCRNSCRGRFQRHGDEHHHDRKQCVPSDLRASSPLRLSAVEGGVRTYHVYDRETNAHCTYSTSDDCGYVNAIVTYPFFSARVATSACTPKP